MHYGCVFFGYEHFVYDPCAGCGDAGDIVTGEVYEHHVLCQFLAVEFQLGFVFSVGVGVDLSV